MYSTVLYSTVSVCSSTFFFRNLFILVWIKVYIEPPHSHSQCSLLHTNKYTPLHTCIQHIYCNTKHKTQNTKHTHTSKMPSIINICVALLALSINIAFSTAIPERRSRGDRRGPGRHNPGLTSPAAYAVPLNNGSATLPDPTNPVQAVTLGRGTQNYTCATSDSGASPKAIGAVATLFDLRALLSSPDTSPGRMVLKIFTPLALNVPRSLLEQVLPSVGTHYFNDQGVPLFDLSQSNNGHILGKKIANIQAPADSTLGQYGAVDWLALDARPGSTGLSRVYRVMTAAGTAPKTCDGMQPTFQIEYAALYYFIAA